MPRLRALLALSSTTNNPVIAILSILSISLLLLISYSTATTSASTHSLLTADVAPSNNKNNNWVANLSVHSASVHSQGGQDGIIAEIFRHVQPLTHTFVEIGFGYVSRDDNHTIERALHGTNTHNLKKPSTFKNLPDENQKPWNGIYFDAVFEHPAIGLYREVVTPDNVVEILRKHNVEKHVDYISIDVDSIDLWLFEAILNTSPLFQPQVISVEYNSNFGYDASVTCDRDWQAWKQDIVYGASLAALLDVAEQYGYEAVHLESYLDVFFVKREKLHESGGKGFTRDEMKEKFPLPIWLHPLSTQSNVSRFVDYGTWRRTKDMKQARKEAVKAVAVVKRMHGSKGV